MTASIPVVILASGRGTGFEAIHRAVLREGLRVEIRAVISDQPEAPVLEKAKKAGLRAICLPFPPRREGQSLIDRRREHETKLLEVLREFQPHFLVLAGYMRVLTSTLIEAF